MTLDLFPLIRAEQRHHGLRFSDFRRYRAHCASRIRNLRRATGLQQVKNRRYKAVPLPDAPKDARVLEISVFEAERCWAAAQELLVAAATAERPGVGQLRHRAQRRLARAVRHATALVAASTNVQTAECAISEIQCVAYLHCLSAEMHASRKNAQGAKQSLDKAERALRNLRTRFPLEQAYSERLELLGVLRKSLGLDKAAVEADEVADLLEAIKHELTIVNRFIRRAEKFKGGFVAAERLCKLVDLIGSVEDTSSMELLCQLEDVKRLFVARSYFAAEKTREAYQCVRRVRVHHEKFFPEFAGVLQRFRLTVGAELLKTLEILPETPALAAEAEEVAEGLEEEKGEEDVAGKQQQTAGGVSGLVGKMASWFGGRK